MKSPPFKSSRLLVSAVGAALLGRGIVGALDPMKPGDVRFSREQFEQSMREKLANTKAEDYLAANIEGWTMLCAEQLIVLGVSPARAPGVAAALFEAKVMPTNEPDITKWAQPIPTAKAHIEANPDDRDLPA